MVLRRGPRRPAAPEPNQTLLDSSQFQCNIRKQALTGMDEGSEVCSCPPESVFRVGENDEEKQKNIEVEGNAVQQRLRDELQQLWTENALFQRLMYKNKNQHRRCLYFRRLTQVQKDLKLLQSLGLNEIVESSSLYLLSEAAADGVSLKLSSAYTYTCQQQKRVRAMLQSLNGAARLLEKMIEPVLNSSAEIAGLLRSSFFMPFALTIFSCLARLRVLIIQIVYDVVTLSNLLAVKYYDDICKQKDGTKWLATTLLECTWQGDCFLLSATRVLLPPKADSVEIAQEPEAPKHPIIQWVVDDRSGKIIDLRRNDRPVESPESLSEDHEIGEPSQVREEDANLRVPAQIDAMNPELAPSQEERGIDVPQTTVVRPPSFQDNVGSERKKMEDKRGTAEPVFPAIKKKRKRGDPETPKLEKRVAYLAVKPSPDSMSILPSLVTPLPRASGGNLKVTTDEPATKSQRMRTDDIFEMLVGRVGKNSLF